MADLRIEQGREINLNKDNYEKIEYIEISITDTIIIIERINPKNKYRWVEIEHKHCGGEIKIQNVRKYNSMFCLGCNLRESLPSYIKTTEQLKEYFEGDEQKIKSRAEILDIR